jgi:hypothetical protein
LVGIRREVRRDSAWGSKVSQKRSLSAAVSLPTAQVVEIDLLLYTIGFPVSSKTFNNDFTTLT